jgi:hypothetical protein
MEPTNARAWGMLALLCRHAAEYGDPSGVSEFVLECEKAARRATELDPLQAEARTALVSIIPLFGRWSEARRGLEAIIEANPTSAVALQDLATLEMATGRIRVSKGLRDALVARDPLCACYCYKSVYQHWSIGDLGGMDVVADRAFSLWPMHPAVWNVRLWTFAYTHRIPASLAMLDKDAPKPAIPAVMLHFLGTVLGAVAEGDRASIDRAVDTCQRAAASGPGNAIAALFAFGLLEQPDCAFEIVNAYYLRDGSGPVPLRHTRSEMSLNEHHRRLTQILFTPVFASFRDDPRFMSICDRVGLTRYWTDEGLTPDFLAAR